MTTDKSKDEQTDEKEIAESQKMSKRDKQQIQEGLCVNCAVVSFIFMVIATIALII